MTFPFPGGTEPVMFGLVDNAPFFTWHVDTFNPPSLPPPISGNHVVGLTKLPFSD